MPPPASAVLVSTSVALVRTTSGALPIANDRPATSNIGTSLTQSPTATASPRLQPARRHSSASAVPLVAPAARTISACLGPLQGADGWFGPLGMYDDSWPIAKLTLYSWACSRSIACASVTERSSPTPTAASGSVCHAASSSTTRRLGDQVLM